MKVPDFDSARCVGIPIDIFFPASEKERNEIKPFVQEMCAVCPVRVACLEYALHVKMLGLWAGTDERERAKIRRQRGIVAESIVHSYDPIEKETKKRKKECKQ